MIAITKLALRCPDIHTQVDAMIVGDLLRDAPGVGQVDIDFVSGKVFVQSANQDHGVDIIRRLSDSGYPPISDE